MAPPTPRRSERGLVMPSGSRRIPRTAPPKRTRGGPADVVEDALPTMVAKAGGDLLTLAARIRSCDDCGRGCDGQVVLGTGHPRAPVMLVTDRPTSADLESGGALTDEAPALEKAFGALGIPMTWLYGTCVVRCGTETPTTDQISTCSGHLIAEIEAVEPAVIVAFGTGARDGIAALDGRCGLRVPDEVPQGVPVRLRPGLSLVVTEPVPLGLTHKDAKRRLWRDLQTVPELLGPPGGTG